MARARLGRSVARVQDNAKRKGSRGIVTKYAEEAKGILPGGPTGGEVSPDVRKVGSKIGTKLKRASRRFLRKHPKLRNSIYGVQNKVEDIGDKVKSTAGKIHGAGKKVYETGKKVYETGKDVVGLGTDIATKRGLSDRVDQAKRVKGLSDKIGVTDKLQKINKFGKNKKKLGDTRFGKYMKRHKEDFKDLAFGNTGERVKSAYGLATDNGRIFDNKTRRSRKKKKIL